MNDKQRAVYVIEKLRQAYPDASCSLIYSNPLQMIIAARLSAQCTDKRVNLTTPKLFLNFRDIHGFANANQKDIEKYIKPCGLYKTKAKNIIDMCRQMVLRFSGGIPDTLKDLTSLPGVGRKTANLVISEIYNKPALVVDTHFIRVTSRLGFHNCKNAFKVESMLKKLIPENESVKFGHRIVQHGREICTARNPKCDNCCLNSVCKYYTKHRIVDYN